MCQLGQSERGEGRIFGRFEHDGAADGQGRRRLPRDHGRGEVPRRYHAHHANWLFDCGNAGIWKGARNRLANHASRFFGRPITERGCIRDFAARFRNWFTIFSSYQRS